MKRRLTIWLLRQFPAQDRFDIMQRANSNLDELVRADFALQFFRDEFPYHHPHRNPVKRRCIRDAGGVDE